MQIAYHISIGAERGRPAASSAVVGVGCAVVGAAKLAIQNQAKRFEKLQAKNVVGRK